MVNFPHYTQLDQMDCGPTCLRMVAKHYGRSFTAQSLREKAQIGKEGVSLLGISEAAESIGFRTMGVKIPFEKLTTEASLPCIVHWDQNHFVVVYDVRGVNGNALLAANFLNRLIAAFQPLTDIHLILSDKHLFVNLPKDIPSNVHIFDWVPQLELLRHCDLMITHGGTNSILEGAYAGVPILSYPLNLSADHPGNTARLVKNGWGLKGDIRRDTEKEIRRQTIKILTNFPAGKEQVQGTLANAQELMIDLAESE